MSLQEEYEFLQSKIAEISNKIFALKDELIQHYDSDHLTEILPLRKKRKSLATKDVFDGCYTEDALKCCFYQNFMVAREKQNSNNMVVIFPTRDERDYGAEIKHEKNGKFTMSKINLPYYISPKKLFKYNEDLEIGELRHNLDAIQKCILARQIRQQQQSDLQQFSNKTGMISISACTHLVRLKTLMENKNGESNLFILLKYSPISFIPSCIEVQFDKDIFSDKNKKKVLKELNIFSKKNLLEAYRHLFNL